MSRNIPEKEMKVLLSLSGGVCAFPGCGKRLHEPGTDSDAAAFLGEMAHIVADSRQGPRGRSALSDVERDRHTNLMLLCGDHHKTVDAQPRTYSVPVLLRMKEEHEGRIRRATSGPVPAAPAPLVREVIHSSLFAVTHLPAAVFAAPCGFTAKQEDQVRQRIRFPDGDDQLVRFVLADGKLFTFHNLKDPNGPFRGVVDQRLVEVIRSQEWWGDPEGHRRYVTLLNRGLYKFAARKRVRFDPAHKRFYFEPITPGQPRQEQYRSLNSKGRLKRNVVWQPKIKSTGQARPFWWHRAAGLSLVRTGQNQWCLSVRPEWHLTSDGEKPLPAKQVGRRVTSKKSGMWNDIYLSEVNFWRDYLSGGKPNLVLSFGDQAAVIGTEMLPFTVEWPGVSGDTKPFANTTYGDDLFTAAELDDASAGEDDWWEESDDESE